MVAAERCNLYHWLRVRVARARAISRLKQQSRLSVPRTGLVVQQKSLLPLRRSFVLTQLEYVSCARSLALCAAAYSFQDFLFGLLFPRSLLCVCVCVANLEQKGTGAVDNPVCPTRKDVIARVGNMA